MNCKKNAANIVDFYYIKQAIAYQTLCFMNIHPIHGILTSLQLQFRKRTDYLSAAALLLGAVVLQGWAFDLELFKECIPILILTK